MTAPHPFPRLVAVAALGALFFTVLALWLPARISGLDLGSGGHRSPSAGEALPSRSGPVLRAVDDAFRQPLAAPLRLMAQPPRAG